MLVDSHCHLNFPELRANLDNLLLQMHENQVDYALVVATRPDNINEVISIAESQPNLFATAGIHPDEVLPDFILTAEYLTEFTKHPKVIAIGETGLDYCGDKEQDFTWQQERFATHIAVAKKVTLPLVIHTRESANDTYEQMKSADISNCGAVMHCFTEGVDWTKKFLDLGCYISLSGIATFKNAAQVHEVAKYVPLDRLLVETDAPYLAPVPFRGKTNHPALVRHTAQYIADLRQIPLEKLAAQTTQNFFTLFRKAPQINP